jgi:periplasmic protein CpxP/Spy
MDPDIHNHDESGAGQSPRKSTNGKLFALLAAVAVAAGGFFGLQAMAETNSYRHLAMAAGDGWHHGWHSGWRRGGGFANLSDAEIEDRIERMVKHVGIEIDASNEQETSLVDLVTAATRDMRPLRDEMRRTRDAMRDLLTADTIDREAIERLRAERLAEFDRVSKNLANTLADVAEVLTPEQRKLLDERIQEFRSRHDERGRG